MIFIGIFILLLALYLYYTTRNHGYWKKKGIKYIPPVPLFGSNFSNIFGFICVQDFTEKIYRDYPEERVVGYYRGSHPELLIRDLDIARHILNTDFSYFYRRGFGRNIKVEPLQANIFGAEGDTWKLLRQRQTSLFTTAKLRSMYPLILNCAERLYEFGEKIIANGGECNIRELMARFSTEFIGACGFGLEINALNEEQSHFRYIGQLLTNPPLASKIKMGLYEYFPELRSLLHVDSPALEEAIFELVDAVRKQRNDQPIGRNDFIDHLLELKKMGKIKGESIEHFKPDGTPMDAEVDMDLKTFAAQVFLFFIAGFETSSSATSYTLHELAFNPDIQEKVQAEIDEVLSRYNNKLCYDAVNEMSYLEMSLKESLRKFPPVAVLNRECAKTYTIPKLDVTLERGAKILIPVQAIHYDEKYYDNPHEFRPERFSAEEVKARDKYAWLPFGEGPRMCIGTRLGMMQAMAGLAVVLSKFTVEPASSSKYVLVKDQTINILQGIKGGMPLKLTHRKKYRAS